MHRVKVKCERVSCSAVSDSFWPHGLSPTRLLCLWDSLGRNASGLPFPFPGDRPNPGIQTWVSCIAGRFFTIWATREMGMHIKAIQYIGRFFFCKYLFKWKSKVHHSLIWDLSRMDSEITLPQWTKSWSTSVYSAQVFTLETHGVWL